MPYGLGDLLKILALPFFIVAVWMFFSSGIVTSISFSKIPWYAYATILIVIFLWITGKK